MKMAAEDGKPVLETTGWKAAESIHEDSRISSTMASSTGEGVTPSPEDSKTASQVKQIGGGSFDTSLLDKASSFINDHLKLFRLVPWVVGGVGLALVIRQQRHMFTRFRRVSDIPRHMFTDNKQLYGIVASTEWDSLNVWHVPFGRRALHWGHQPQKSCPKDELFRVKFAGVAVGQAEELERWLVTNMVHKRVWCTLLQPQGKRTLHCVVHAKKKGFISFKFCVNKALIEEGLGSVSEAQGFRSNQEYISFIQQLSTREEAAKRKGTGMWEGTEYVSWWRRGGRFLGRMVGSSKEPSNQS